jgi:hypothetical protein
MSLWHVDQANVDYVHRGETGYPEHLAKLDTREALWDACGSASREFPQSLFIERKDWKAKAEENDRNKTWALNYIDRFTHQGSSHECTSHSLRAVMEAARNRHRAIIFPEGPKKDFRYPESAKSGSVWLSPLSIYAEANPGVRGGANVQQVLNIAARRGMLPEKTQPAEYNFKHSIVGTAGGSSSTMNQSVGSWVAVRNFPEGWEETAKLFKPLEVVFPRSMEEAMCLILHGYALGVGRSGHAVPLGAWDCEKNLFPYSDSYNTVRFDSRIAWQGSFAIISTTTPDDWSKPNV